MEVYQWLFRKNDFRVSNTGYFVYCNGDSDAKAFDGKLEFDVKVIPYMGNDDWVEPTIVAAHACLNGETIPVAGEKCDYCAYRQAAGGRRRNMTILNSVLGDITQQNVDAIVNAACAVQPKRLRFVYEDS